jgi:predicted transcriptional regulator
MNGAENSTTTMTIRLPIEMKVQLEALAHATGRNKTFLAQEALRQYLEVASWQIASIQRGIEDANAGRFATDDEMRDVWSEFVRVRWTDEARNALRQARQYIARENPDAGREMAARIRAAAKHLADYPEMGRAGRAESLTTMCRL